MLHVDIVVTPERGQTQRRDVPAGTDLLTRDDIERSPADSGVELLAGLPGLQVLCAAPGQMPIVSARGFFGGGEAEYVQLLVDGVPLARVESGIAEWGLLRAVAISRVETLRGPASALYGDTALGGVIQVFTNRATHDHATLSISDASWSTWSIDAAAGFQMRRSRGTASAGYLRTNGFSDRSGARQAQAALRAEVPAVEGVWDMGAGFWWRDREDPGPRSPSELHDDRFGSNQLFAGDGERVSRGYGNISYHHSSGAVVYDASGYATHSAGHQQRTVPLMPEYGIRATRETDASSVGASGVLTSRVRALEWRAGTDGAYEVLGTRYPETGLGELVPRTPVADGARQRIAAFASVAWSGMPRVRIVQGIRYDRILDAFTTPAAHSTQDAWSPRLGATVLAGDVARPVSLFAQVSRAFKAATLDQLFDPRPLPDFRGGTFTVSNRLLQPQRAVNVEAGASQRVGSLDWQAVAYRTSVVDEIDFDIATYSYRNIGRSNHTGVELDASWRLSRRFVSHAAYTWTRVRAADQSGPAGQLKNIPAHRWQLGMSAEARGATLDLRVTGSEGAFLDDENRFPLAGGATVDARIARRVRRVRLRIDALNLFDARRDAYGFVLSDFRGTGVAYTYPSPPRLLRAGVDWAF